MSTQFVFGVFGAGLGSMFGMPQLGWMLGTMVGGMIDPMVIRQEGPRLDDLKVQTSTWGKMIPIIYGSMRLSGNVIWSTNIRETKNIESGGKGGPETEVTTYTYSIDMAVSVCAGSVFGIRKIWANNKLIYNTDPTASVETIVNNNSNNIKIYLGTETQLPDPTIEADKGVGNVPAYRGQVYVVFNDFELGIYGNRIPNLEFEVIQSGTELGYRSLLSVADFSYPFTLDPRQDVFISLEEGIFRVTKEGFNEYAYLTSLDGKYLGTDYRTYLEQTISGAFSTMLDFGNDGEIFSLRNNTILPSPIGLSTFPVLFLQKNGLPFLSNIFASNEYLSGACLSVDKKIITVATILVNAGAVSGQKWYQFYTDGRLYRSGVLTIPNIVPRVEFGWNVNFSLEFSANKYQAMVESDYDHMWIPQLKRFVSVALFKIDPITLVMSLIERGNPQLTTDYSGHNRSAIYADNGIMVYRNSIQFQAMTRNKTVSPTKVTLSSIVLDQCLRSGLSASDVDVSNLTDQVTGFMIPRQGTARDNISQLQKAFFFDAYESEGKIKFRKRGGAAVAAIPYDDLAAHRAGEDPGDPLEITRSQEVDLPVSVTIKYLNEASDYQVSAEITKRLVTASKQAMTEEISVAMTANKAAQISEVLMYDAHVARTAYTFQTSRKYAYLEPTDVVTVQTPKFSHRLRILKKDDSDVLIRFDAVADEASIYASTAVGGSAIPPQLIAAGPGPTKIEFLDVPIVRDADNDAGMYIAMTGYKDEWKGASVLRSNDPLSFLQVASVDDKAAVGFTTSVLGSWSGKNFPDESSVVTVQLISGTLSGISFDELINGGNLALIGSEIVQFRTATLISPNVYRLSGMLRGRQGTGNFSNSHATPERFVLFRTAGIVRVNEGIGALNAARYYKAVSYGNKISNAGAYPFTNTGKGLQPYRPVHFYAARQPNNNWIFQWVRRTRVDGLWRNSVEVSLGETAEQYELEIMSSNAGTTVRRLITSTTPTATYTSAQQTADFGSAQTSVRARLYQISSSYGRSASQDVIF